MYKRPVSELTESAKLGNNNACEQLIIKNSNIIIKFATNAYNEIKIKYINYYHIDEDNFIMPSNLIMLDDIIQDFYIQALLILNNYIDIDNQLYFSTYLCDYLMKYKKKYVRCTIKKLLNIYDNEIIETIDLQFKKLMDEKEKNDLINQLMMVIDNDNSLIIYKQFIKDILDGLSYQELNTIYNLRNSRINMRIKIFVEAFKKNKQKNLALVDSLNEQYIYHKFCNNQLFDVPIYNYYLEIGTKEIFENINSELDVSYEEIKNHLANTIIKVLNKYMQDKIFNFNEFHAFFTIRIYQYIHSYKRNIPKKLVRNKQMIKILQSNEN